MNNCAVITTGEGATMQVERASRALGAGVQGIDPGEPLDGETFASVREALDRHSVLVLPDRDVEPPRKSSSAGASTD